MSTQTRRAITAKDLFQFQLISEPRFSPAGDRVAFVVTDIDKETDGYLSSIYFVDPETDSTKRLTAAAGEDSSPRWSPDGLQLAFISNRSAGASDDEPKKQVWLIRTNGGEAWRLTLFDEGVSAFDWSPDGTALVVQSKSTATSSETEETSEQDDDATDVVHITTIRYRANGTPGFLDQKASNLWIAPIDGSDPTLLTSDETYDDRGPVWSPSGQHIAFVSNRSEDRERNYNSVSEIWAVPAGGGEARPLLAGDSASFGRPVWSQDGSSVAAIGHFEADRGGSVDNDIWIASLDGASRSITGEFNRSASDSAMSDLFKGSNASLVWSPDGQQVTFLASDTGSTHIYRVGAEGGPVSQISSGERRISAIDSNPDGSQIALLSASTTEPGNLYIMNADGSGERRLTNLNDALLDQIAVQEPESFFFDSADGTEVQGWILKPPGFDSTKKYPLILQIHGGPHGMYANAFTHEFQLMAARGYVVVYTNPRGSAGYGQDFTTATHLRWGETDMPDLMAAVDYVIGQGYIDESRLGVTGGSYGGYMTLWVVGHTDRFKAAVTQRCVSNLYSFYGTSDIGWTFIDYEFGGKAWEHREHYMKYSPISYVEQMTTPLLIIHSEQDYRCPIEQAEQVFISLKKLGRETELVRFPDENHDLSRSGKPKHRIERLNYIIGWFDRYL